MIIKGNFKSAIRRSHVGRVFVRLAFATLWVAASVGSAAAATSAGGVKWLEPLGYAKPPFIPITLPTITTNYYVDLSSGSDSSGCGTSTSNPCKTLRGLVGRNLAGLRGNSADGAAAINIRGSGSGAFYVFSDTLAGTPGKEILIRPWGSSVVTFRRGAQNQGLNDGNVHDVIVDGGDPTTGEMLFKFVGDYAGCGGPCRALSISGNNITIARSQFTATTTTGNGWVDLVAVCNVSNKRCQNIRFINNEFYDCATQANQCNAVYATPCGATSGCSISGLYLLGNIVRNIGGDGLFVNPRVTSDNVVIAGNAVHNVGYRTCNDGGVRECRPAITLNINQSGSLNNVVIRNNLLWDTGSGCIWDKSGSSGTSVARIDNNVCYDYGNDGSSHNPAPQGITSNNFGSNAMVRNNIIYDPEGQNPFGSNNISFDVATNNLCGSSESCGSAKRVWSSSTVLSTSEDSPNFMRIADDSEAAGAGLPLTSEGITTDYMNLQRTATSFDIGPFAADGEPALVPAPPGSLAVL